MNKQRFPGFDACIAMMRKHNPQTQEDGFQFLLPRASEYLHELIEEFEKEKDHGLRCWLLELIGEAKSSKAFPLFVEYLKSENESFRTWSAFGLHKLNIKEARDILWEARSYTFDDEEETKRFQETLDKVQQQK